MLAEQESHLRAKLSTTSSGKELKPMEGEVVEDTTMETIAKKRTHSIYQ